MATERVTATDDHGTHAPQLAKRVEHLTMAERAAKGKDAREAVPRFSRT